MNWTRFQTYNDAPSRAFETLCNQLFENWCQTEYKDKLASFMVVNGSGGDGGVESYAVLSDGSIVGLQAKWFPTAIGSNQMSQIKNSVTTALNIRPTITRYIVCVPRDISSLTGRGSNTESSRWENMKNSVLADNPGLNIELWDETRLTYELQKDSSAGILKFWFERSEISEETVKFSFEKSRESWLSTKYVPELNTFGMIHKSVSECLGNVDQRLQLNEQFNRIRVLCNEFSSASNELISVCEKRNSWIIPILNSTNSQLDTLLLETKKIQAWLQNESSLILDFDESAFWIDFSGIVKQLKGSSEQYNHYFHFSAVAKALQLLDEVEIEQLILQIKHAVNRRSLVFLGEPGTGKTHGIAAETEQLLDDGFHIPILIQARDIPASFTWRDILVSTLGLASSWSEEEIWQALSSLANRKRINTLSSSDQVHLFSKVIIFVDGIDESSHHNRWIERVQEASAITKNYAAIRFCFLSRPHVFKEQNIVGRVININANGDAPTYKLFNSYARKYNIDVSNAGWLKYALTTPLALKLFCELNEGKTIQYHSGADVSIADLLKEKISMLECEYCRQETTATPADQYVFAAVLLFSEFFSNETHIERKQAISLLAQKLSIDDIQSQKLVHFLEDYGILHLYCKPGTGLLSLDTYFLQPGIQGYFDYVSALVLIEKYVSPEKIEFCECKNLSQNSFYILAIISMQNFGYLLADNNSITATIGASFKEELSFFALRHAKPVQAEQFKPRLLALMASSAETLRQITNSIILPLSREPHHPLSVPLLDEFLIGFEHSAKRDILWSIPSFLEYSEGEIWYCETELDIGQDAYILTNADTNDGLPTVYAWLLATVVNSKRQEYRDSLMKWALEVPSEFFALFVKFSSVNDPQIRSDIFSILMCVLFEDENTELLTTAAYWLMENVLAPEKIENNRDIAIRYFSTSIVRKAMCLGLIDSGSAAQYLPPFKQNSNDIALSEEALAGTYMGGYKGITYDLGRYVLIDHITSALPNHNKNAKKQYKKLFDSIAKKQPKFAGISIEQFTLSAAYEFICSHGWNEPEFRYYNSADGKVSGVDYAISRAYMPATHGTQSSVMTICEKYVWQSRNYISGFLADRIMYVDDYGQASYVNDYCWLDDFLIPAMEITQVNPQEAKELYPWHIPEADNVMISNNYDSKDDVIESIKTAPDISWKKWVQIDNSKQQYPLNSSRLIALTSFSCFESPYGVETNLFVNSILIDENDIYSFIDIMVNNSDISDRTANPTEWDGSVYSHCYITPKEICWMPWKSRYDSRFVEEFSSLEIHSAVDSCTYNFLDYGDVSYNLPSAPVRDLLGIVNTNGYKFYDKDNQIKAISISVGESWRTEQEQLLVSESLLDSLQSIGKTLVWIMREDRRVNVKARERFGDFYVDKDHSYIGFYRGKEFIVMRIPLKESTNSQEDFLAYDL